MAKKQKNIKSALKTGIMGSIIGFVNGFLGSGGGMICVPMLEKMKGLETHKAHATAILIMLPFSAVSGAVYLFNYEFDWGIWAMIAGGAAVGAIIGSLCLKKFSGKLVRIIFACVMAFSAVWMVVA